MEFVQIAVAAIIAGLALALIHVLAVHGDNARLRRLSQPPLNYIVGMATLGVPYVGLLWLWNDRWPIAAFVALTIVGGTPVLIGYLTKLISDLKSEIRTLKAHVRELTDG